MANVQYYDVILKPVITEKSMADMADKKYTFLVHTDANKTMIKEAVEIYNNERTHWSLDLKTPQEAHNELDKHINKSYSKKVA